MNPLVMVYGIAVFLACMVLHIVIWRMKTPWVSSLILLVVFLFVPSVFFCFFMVSDFIKKALSLNTIELLEILLLHVSFSSAYIASYPAVRAVSPSLDILIMISSSPSQKKTMEELKQDFAKKRLVSARVDDLKAYRLIVEKEGRFELRPIAVVIVKLFVFYRQLLGLSIGSG
jgi:hypothetical protein